MQSTEKKEMMIWVLCPSCGAVVLDGYIPPDWTKYTVEDLMGCNLCGNFVCPDCMTDHEGNISEWCISCEQKENGLRPDHPDDRLRVDPSFL